MAEMAWLLYRNEKLGEAGRKEVHDLERFRLGGAGWNERSQDANMDSVTGT